MQRLNQRRGGCNRCALARGQSARAVGYDENRGLRSEGNQRDRILVRPLALLPEVCGLGNVAVMPA